MRGVHKLSRFFVKTSRWVSSILIGFAAVQCSLPSFGDGISRTTVCGIAVNESRESVYEKMPGQLGFVSNPDAVFSLKGALGIVFESGRVKSISGDNVTFEGKSLSLGLSEEESRAALGTPAEVISLDVERKRDLVYFAGDSFLLVNLSDERGQWRVDKYNVGKLENWEHLREVLLGKVEH